LSDLGRPRLHLRRIDSTNDRARELAIGGAPNGTLVTAGEQTAGRGRQGRRWSAPADSAILMSLVLRSPPTLLPLMAAVAVCDLAGEGARIKWPNDVVLETPPAEGGRPPARSPDRGSPPALAKLAGILTEGRPQQGWAVLGIGVNVAVELSELPAQLRGQAGGEDPSPGSLPAATLGWGRAEIEPALARLLLALERRLAQPPATILDEWRSRDALKGREIAWEGGRGRARGVDGEGRLIVALDGGGRTTLNAGEVHLTSVS